MADCSLIWQGYHDLCNSRRVSCLWQKYKSRCISKCFDGASYTDVPCHPYFFIINSTPRVARLHFRRHRHPTHVPGTFH